MDLSQPNTHRYSAIYGQQAHEYLRRATGISDRCAGKWCSETGHCPHLAPSLGNAHARSGVSLRVIQGCLGHSSLKTSTIYTHITRKAEVPANEAINQVLDELQR